MNSSKMMMTADDMEEDLSSQDSYEAKHPQQTYTSLAPKKRKYNEEERIRRCRERNRVHARNTRERKKMQLDLLEYRIQELIDERIKLKCTDADTSVASILMSLAGVQTMKSVQREEDQAAYLLSTTGNAGGSSSAGAGADADNDAGGLATMLAVSEMGSPLSEFQMHGKLTVAESAAALAQQTATSQFARSYTDSTIEKIRQEVANILSGDDSLDIDTELLQKDKSACTSSELDMIRRERNRMHAKRTRLRKKKMLQELEAIVTQLETEIKQLYKERGIAPQTIVDQAMGNHHSSSHDYRMSRDLRDLTTPNHTSVGSRHHSSNHSNSSSSGSGSGSGSGNESRQHRDGTADRSMASKTHSNREYDESAAIGIEILAATAQYGTLTRSHLNDHDMKSARPNLTDIKNSTHMQPSHNPDIRHMVSTESNTTHAYSSTDSSSTDCYDIVQNNHQRGGHHNSSHTGSGTGSGSGSGSGGSSNSENGGLASSEEEHDQNGSSSESDTAVRVRNSQGPMSNHVLSNVTGHRKRSISVTEGSSGDDSSS